MLEMARRYRTAALIAAVAPLAAGCSSASGGFETAAHLPYPQIPTEDGPTLASATIVTVSFAGDPNAVPLSAFVDWLAQSGWPAAVAGEYGVRTLEHRAHVTLSETAPGAVADSDIAALIAAKTADGTVPSAAPPEAPFVYVLFLPDGTTATHLGGPTCSANPGNGYHDAIVSGALQIPVIVLPVCDPRFTAILSPLEGMELDLARLVVDMLTDVSPENEPAYSLDDDSIPWTALGTELGDFCWGRLTQAGSGYTLQRVWSNEAAAAGGEPCLPTVPASAAFGASVSPTGLPTLIVGVPSVFEVSGWSRAVVPDWTLQATPWIGDYAIGASLDADTLNNGRTATLTITIPYPVPSGTYGAVRVQSASAIDAPSWPVAFLVKAAP